MSGKSNHKLLVVDDNPGNCDVAKRCLEDSYEIEIALCGEEAIAKIYDFDPAVVLLDVRMPRIKGNELVKMIKTWKPEVHIIMVSAFLTPEIENYCKQNGALDCFNKPLDFEHIDETIQKALNP